VGKTEVEFTSNSSWGRHRGGIWMQIQVGGEAEWNLDANSSWGRRRGGIWMQIPAGC